MGGFGSSQAINECDKLDEWLAQSPVPTEDPLHWWLTNQRLYPHLSHMAIDVHATPGKSFPIFFKMSLTFLYQLLLLNRAVVQPWTNSYQSPTQSAASIFHSGFNVSWRLVPTPVGIRC